MTGATSLLVRLDEFPDLGLIVKAATGVRYSSQVAGLGCEHPKVEGYLVPLETRIGRPELAALAGLFQGWWNCLNVQQADAVGRALNRYGFKSIRVDRAMLPHSREAWVHVIVSQPLEEESIPLTGLSEDVTAILIWPNSD